MGVVNVVKPGGGENLEDYEVALTYPHLSSGSWKLLQPGESAAYSIAVVTSSMLYYGAPARVDAVMVLLTVQLDIQGGITFVRERFLPSSATFFVTAGESVDIAPAEGYFDYTVALSGDGVTVTVTLRNRHLVEMSANIMSSIIVGLLKK